MRGKEKEKEGGVVTLVLEEVVVIMWLVKREPEEGEWQRWAAMG